MYVLPSLGRVVAALAELQSNYICPLASSVGPTEYIPTLLQDLGSSKLVPDTDPGSRSYSGRDPGSSPGQVFPAHILNYRRYRCGLDAIYEKGVETPV